jgi:glycosyltransferase involved in cell wall biosynthesis
VRDLYPLLRSDFDVQVGTSEPGRFFASDLNGYPLFEDRPGSSALFDLAFKPCQLFTWAEFRRMSRLAPRISFVLQDIIAVRCNYLTSIDRNTLFEKTAELADHVLAISRYTLSDFNAFFGQNLAAEVIHHGTNLGGDPLESWRDEHVLVMGNDFAHKGVKDALPYLKEAGPVAVLGGLAPSEIPPNVKWYTSGSLSRTQIRQLFAKTSVLVYPSHYEGYGLPVVDVLALGKPVVALDTEVNRELQSSLENPKFQLIRSMEHLPEAVTAALQMGQRDGKMRPDNVRTWKHVAEDYAESIRKWVAMPPNPQKMRGRYELFRVMDASRHI